MKIDILVTPRKYRVGLKKQIEISDCGKVYPVADEQLTFVTPSGREYDVAAKSWGFYATPSVNKRLTGQGFKTALVKNSEGRIYVMLVEKDRLMAFQTYLDEEKQVVVEWLDERR